jgi:hypothetical protein
MTSRALALLAVAFTPAMALAQLAPFEGRDPAECAAMSTAAIEVYAYEVQPGQGCGAVSQAVFGDRHRDDIIHRFNPSMGPPPHRLIPGTHLCLPREAPEDLGPAAQITAIRQRVRSRAPTASDWINAALLQPLTSGERVDVRTRAFAELTFRNTSVITLRGDTLVVVYGDEVRDARTTARSATLERGALRSRLGALRGRVDTPTAEVRLAGGQAVTSVDDEDVSRVSMHGGPPARVRSRSGGAVSLPAGMGTTVERGRRPTRPRPLPDAPQWDATHPTRFVGTAQRTTVRGRWAAVPGARVYRVELARRPDGRDLAAALEMPAEATAFELHDLPPGRYYLSLSTIDGSFYESRPSEAVPIDLALAGLRQEGEPPEGEPAFAGGFRFDDEVEAPPRVLPGARFDAPDGLRCGTDEAPLADASGPLVLEAPGTQRIRCLDAEGTEVDGIDVEVAAVELQPATGQSLSLRRGQEHDVTLTVRSDLPLPEPLAFDAFTGVEVLAVEPTDGGLAVRLRIADDAPEEGTLTLRRAGGETDLASVSLSTRPPEAPPVLEEPEEPPATAGYWGESLGVPSTSAFVGTRDLGREGVGIYAGVLGTEPGVPTERLRVTGGAWASLLDRRLFLEAAVSGDALGSHPRASQQGVGDPYAAAGSTFELGDADLRLQVGAFLPAGAAGGLPSVRLVPSGQLTLPLDRLLQFRMRQAVLVDLDDSGNVSWASAYALDLRLEEIVLLGLEGQLSLGEEGEAWLALPAVALRAEIVLGPVILGGAFRLTPGDAEDVFGLWTALGHVGVVLWDPR